MQDFIDEVADQLAGLPAVQAVTLGGSRAQGTARPDSDWDLGIYYRGDFDPQSLRDLRQHVGWEGQVSEVGGWGGGVFNGGAWLRIDGHQVDVHYRDLDVVEREAGRAEKGEFSIEPLMFHLAGIPTHLMAAELAVNQVLRGRLPVVQEYPPALRQTAGEQWESRARMHFDYAERNHAAHGRIAQCLGLLAVAATEHAHSVLAKRGEWVTNEKRILAQAGLQDLDQVLGDSVDLDGVIRTLRIS